MRALFVVLVVGCGASEARPEAAPNETVAAEPIATPIDEPAAAEPIAEDVGCVTPWYLDPARGPDMLTCRTDDGTEVSTECEACALRDGVCFADLPGEVVERRALDGTHHRFSASHTCVAACCEREQLTALPPRG